MKIVHVINRFAKIDGGPPHGLLTIAKSQAEFGNDVIIFPATNTGGEMVLQPGQYGNMRIVNPVCARRLVFADYHLYGSLAEYILEADIVHIHGSWRYHLIAAAKLSIKYNKPYIIRPAGNLGRIPRRYKKYFKIPYFHFCEKKYFEQASAIHCCTQKEYEEISDLKLKCDFIIVPQPVDGNLSKYEINHNEVYKLCPGITQQSKVLLYLGRISWIKQIQMLVDSFISVHNKLQNKDIYSIIAGPFENPEILDDLKTKIKIAGVQDKVHFPGLIKDNIKASFLSRADIFVQPSKHENFGMSVAEALYFGKPCIVNNGVALSSEIGKYNAGLCFDNSEQLTNAIIRLIDDKHFAKECSLNALKLAEIFKANVVTNQLMNYYSKFSEEKKGKDEK